jgi:cell division septation protein DedD
MLLRLFCILSLVTSVCASNRSALSPLQGLETAITAEPIDAATLEVMRSTALDSLINPVARRHAWYQIALYEYARGQYIRASQSFQNYFALPGDLHKRAYYWAAISNWLGSRQDSTLKAAATQYIIKGLAMLEPEDAAFAELLVLRAYLFLDDQKYLQAEQQYLSAKHYAPPSLEGLMSDLCTQLYTRMNQNEKAASCREVPALASAPAPMALLMEEPEKPQAPPAPAPTTAPVAPPVLNYFTLQVGAFSSMDNARRMEQDLLSHNALRGNIFIEQRSGSALPLFVVQVGRFTTRGEAETFAATHLDPIGRAFFVYQKN